MSVGGRSASTCPGWQRASMAGMPAASIAHGVRGMHVTPSLVWGSAITCLWAVDTASPPMWLVKRINHVAQGIQYCARVLGTRGAMRL